MKRPESNKSESHWLGRYTWFMLILWTAIVGALFLFNFMSIRKEFRALARLEAIASFNKDVVYRRWATIHGGVYVPVTEKTPSNIYLNVQERDISTPSGKKTDPGESSLYDPPGPRTGEGTIRSSRAYHELKAPQSRKCSRSLGDRGSEIL